MKTPEQIMLELNWTYDSDPARFQLFNELIKPAMELYAQQGKWLSVSDSNMPKFYENYLLCINGTVQYITYQFAGKEVDEKWLMDESDPEYWFQADYGGETHQVLITDSVFFQELPNPPKQ